SKAERVRVEVFSNTRAISFPARRCVSMPAYLAIFSALARSSRNRSSAAVKSISLRKLRLRRFCIGGTSGVGAGRSVRRVALERAAEAVGTAAAAAELAARHGDDLDADLAQLGVRVGVALVAEDDARLDGEQVVAVVPLLALGLELVAPRRHDVELADAEGAGERLDEPVGLGLDDDVVGRVAGPHRP